MTARTLSEWQAEIGAWHLVTFPWARIPHILEKLEEERHEAALAWAKGHVNDTADELADCLICVLAAMAREGVNVDLALASKFERVQQKYAELQPSPGDAEPELLL